MEIIDKKLSSKYKNYNGVIFISVFSIIIYILAARFNNHFVKIMPVASFLAWHSLFEFASILVSFSIFTVTYFVYKESKDLKMILFACVFLLTGLLDTFHTFSYKGMPYFFIANTTANRATTLWILSRLLGNLGFMIAIAIPPNIKSNIKKEFFYF